MFMLVITSNMKLTVLQYLLARLLASGASLMSQACCQHVRHASRCWRVQLVILQLSTDLCPLLPSTTWTLDLEPAALIGPIRFSTSALSRHPATSQMAQNKHLSSEISGAGLIGAWFRTLMKLAQILVQVTGPEFAGDWPTGPGHSRTL